MSPQKLDPGAKRPFGFSRSRHILSPDKLSGVLDLSPSYGWHECNEKYSVHRTVGANLMDSYLLIFTVSGEGVATVEQQEYTLTAQSCMIFPKGVSHAYRVLPGGKWEFYWMHLQGPLSEALLSYLIQEYGYQYTTGCQREATEYIELLMNTEYRYWKYELFATQVISKLLFALLGDLSEQRGETHMRKNLALQVIDYIEAHYKKSIRLTDISGHLYVSPEHMIRVFKEETGMTPYQYAKGYRMRRACQLLDETNMSIAAIAQTVGYCSPSAFIAQFKQMYHTTPQSYRKATR